MFEELSKNYLVSDILPSSVPNGSNIVRTKLPFRKQLTFTVKYPFLPELTQQSFQVSRGVFTRLRAHRKLFPRTLHNHLGLNPGRKSPREGYRLASGHCKFSNPPRLFLLITHSTPTSQPPQEIIGSIPELSAASQYIKLLHYHACYRYISICSSVCTKLLVFDLPSHQTLLQPHDWQPTDRSFSKHITPSSA